MHGIITFTAGAAATGAVTTYGFQKLSERLLGDLFKTELDNRIAHLVVACFASLAVAAVAVGTALVLPGSAALFLDGSVLYVLYQFVWALGEARCARMDREKKQRTKVQNETNDEMREVSRTLRELNSILASLVKERSSLREEVASLRGERGIEEPSEGQPPSGNLKRLLS